jgi:hypothetical protein
MRMDVHAREVGDELLITILFDVEDEQALVLLAVAAITLAAQKNPELQRHVEAWETVRFVEFGPGQVVDAVTTLLDDAVQLFQPDLATVVRLPCRTRPESAGIYGEYQRLKKRGVGVVERAVYEDVVGRRPSGSQATSSSNEGFLPPSASSELQARCLSRRAPGRSGRWLRCVPAHARRTCRA